MRRVVITDPKDTHALQLDFVRIEMETGLTFAQIARDARHDPLKRDRNRRNAQTALDTAIKFASRLDVSDDVVKEIHERIEDLRKAIQAIPA